MLPSPFEFYVQSATRRIYSDLVIACAEDWEDSHGAQKTCLQHVLLPHEIVANFLENNEAHRMIGYGNLSDFWEPESSTAWFMAHPVLSESCLQ